MQRILIIGATSAIAQAAARIYAANGANLFLVARSSERLSFLAADLVSRGAAEVATCELDVVDMQKHDDSLQEAVGFLGEIDIAIIAHGTLPDQSLCESDVELARNELDTNATSTISLMILLANQFERQRSGTLAVISSVAGDRGRQSNYVYGAAKAAVSAAAQGLRNRLSKVGVHVMTIKPGFVDTPMTADFPKGFLWAKPGAVAKTIVRAIERRKDVLYVPFFWRYIMLLIRLIPERFFKKMNL